MIAYSRPFQQSLKSYQTWSTVFACLRNTLPVHCAIQRTFSGCLFWEFNQGIQRNTLGALKIMTNFLHALKIKTNVLLLLWRYSPMMALYLPLSPSPYSSVEWLRLPISKTEQPVTWVGHGVLLSFSGLPRWSFIFYHVFRLKPGNSFGVHMLYMACPLEFSKLNMESTSHSSYNRCNPLLSLIHYASSPEDSKFKSRDFLLTRLIQCPRLAGITPPFFEVCFPMPIYSDLC